MKIACGWRVLAAIMLAGCGMPRLIDPAGLPVDRPLLIAAVPGGWVVVDSAGSRVRAIAQLTTPVAFHGSARPDDSRPELRCHAGLASVLTRYRREPPACGERLPVNACGSAERCGAASQDASRCVEVVRAEFSLERLPQEGDSLTFVDGEHTSSTRWSRP